MYTMNQTEREYIADMFEWAVQFDIAFQIRAYNTHVNVGTKRHKIKPQFKCEYRYLEGNEWKTGNLIGDSISELRYQLGSFMHKKYDELQVSGDNMESLDEFGDPIQADDDVEGEGLEDML